MHSFEVPAVSFFTFGFRKSVAGVQNGFCKAPVNIVHVCNSNTRFFDIHRKVLLYLSRSLYVFYEDYNGGFAKVTTMSTLGPRPSSSAARNVPRVRNETMTSRLASGNFSFLTKKGSLFPRGLLHTLGKR